jgi:AcrR family transcriptional regulator
MTVKRRGYKSDVRAIAAGETRARIITAARELLAGGRNVPAFSLDAVARRARVSRLTVYNQFESRRGLLEAVFDDTAKTGGLFQLPVILAEADFDQALRQFVSLFCAFWARHGDVFSQIHANAVLDEEIAASLRERSERRRAVLRSLVGRLNLGKRQSELVDLLFGVTSFELHQMLCRAGRSSSTVESLMQRMALDAVSRYR